MVVGQDLIGDPCDVTPEAPLLGLLQQRLGLHRDLIGAVFLAIGCGRGQHQRGRMWLDLGIDALIGSCEQRVALLNFRIDAPVSSGPVGVFAKQTDTSGDKDFQLVASSRRIAVNLAEWMWQMATAMASAASSGWGTLSRARSILTICWTWSLVARP